MRLPTCLCRYWLVELIWVLSLQLHQSRVRRERRLAVTLNRGEERFLYILRWSIWIAKFGQHANQNHCIGKAYDHSLVERWIFQLISHEHSSVFFNVIMLTSFFQNLTIMNRMMFYHGLCRRMELYLPLGDRKSMNIYKAWQFDHATRGSLCITISRSAAHGVVHAISFVKECFIERLDVLWGIMVSHQKIVRIRHAYIQ